MVKRLYEGNSKINLRLVAKKKRTVIVPKCRLSSNKLGLLSLNAYPHTFSLRSVGVITDETWTLSSPLPPSVRYMLWFFFFTQKDIAWLRFIVSCVVYKVIMLWVTIVWENGAENSGIGALICMTNGVKNDTQLWLMNPFKKSTNACVETSFHDIRTFWRVSTNFEDYLVSNCHRQFGLPYVLCTVGTKTTDWLGCTVLWRGTTKTSVTVRQVPKSGWQLCGEVMQVCM